MYKALALISGGLDSMLAAKLILQQNIAVEGINFFTGFTGENPDTENIKPHGARWVAKQLGIKLHVIDAFAKFKPVLTAPQYGYGKNLNPCLDCKIFMVNQSMQFIKENEFDFLITGEVLGQRPMSQRKDTMPLVAKDTDDLLLRPLCAKLLRPTLPEREGWVNRELLCAINGRSRKPQIELAAHFGLKTYPQPAGGCALTDNNFCDRLRDLWQSRSNKNYSNTDISLLKIGRHLRIKPNLKLIIGRDEKENNFLEKFSTQFISLQSQNHPGALVLIDGIVDPKELGFAARIAAYFSKGKTAENVEILIHYPDTNIQLLTIKPLSVSEIHKEWHI